MLKILMGALVMLITQTSLYAGTTPTMENTTKLYVATFNRAPDTGGLNYWANDAGLDLEGIAQSFFDQPETKAVYPSDSTNTDFIEAVYQNLFNRPSETAGLTYWVGELDSGRIAKSTFILAVINGAKDTEEFGNDATILTNKTTVGVAFAHAGREDVTLAADVMDGVTDDLSTVASALNKLESASFTFTPIGPDDAGCSNVSRGCIEIIDYGYRYHDSKREYRVEYKNRCSIPLVHKFCIREGNGEPICEGTEDWHVGLVYTLPPSEVQTTNNNWIEFDLKDLGSSVVTWDWRIMGAEEELIEHFCPSRHPLDDWDDEESWWYYPLGYDKLFGDPKYPTNTVSDS